MGMKSTVAVALLLLASKGFAGETGRLPVDWFVLPENQQTWERTVGNQAVETREGNTYRRNMQSVETSVDQVFTTTAESLGRVPNVKGRTLRPTNAPANWFPWHMSTVKMKMALSQKGSLGIVAGKATTGVELVWKRSAQGYKALGFDTNRYGEYQEKQSGSVIEAPDFAMNEYTSYADIEQKMDVIAQAVFATGRVKNKDRVKSGLVQNAIEMRDMMMNANSYNYSTYGAEKYRVELSVSAEGWVFWGVTVGGEVRLRFEWKRSNYGPMLPEVQDGKYAEHNQFREFIAALGEDLEKGARPELYAESGFGLKYVRVGVGVAVSGSIGIIKIEGKAIGFIYFAANPQHLNAIHHNYARHELPTTLPLIAESPPEQHLAYAAANNVNYMFVRDPATGAFDKVVYQMPRDEFKKGMEKATTIGAFYAKRANLTTHGASYSGDWSIAEVKPSFEASLKGSVGIVGVEGIGSVEFTFAKY